jgi:type III restriction enzyme
VRPTTVVNEDVAERIAGLLDLRVPNHQALLSVAHRLTGAPVPFEGVVDVATGVGKTFILAALIDYLAEVSDVRNFVIIAPGRTILEKTLDNFTAGARKSLVDKMSTRPVLVTADNFNSPEIRRVLDDPNEVKVFVFTVQSLTGTRNEQRRKVHKFQEGLGEDLYGYLTRSDDLVVIADEHHCYYGPAFSAAIRDLDPYALIGLTATPHTRTPLSQIVYQYPLANAIADKLVKTPVIVGRSDDRNDAETKLRDGLTLLQAKETALKKYCEAESLQTVNPVMLVVAPTIEEAKDVEDLLNDPEFYGGRYAGCVLRIDSEAPDESLAALAEVEDVTSPVRVIVSVGMLKEGWDVANVYVIVSLRSSVSEILTEQTLGRGLRLPFGKYTGTELLDTLEVVAHERYEDLLRRAKVLKGRVIDWRTADADATAAGGDGVTSTSGPTQPGIPAGTDVAGEVPAGTEAVSPTVVSTETGPGEPGELVMVIAGSEEPEPVGDPEVVTATTVQSRTEQAQAEALRVAELAPKPELSPVQVPVLETVPVPTQFSLVDVTDMAPFRAYGRQLAVDPSDALRRSVVSASFKQGPSGIPEVELSTRRAEDTIYSQGVLLDPEEARQQLLKRLVAAPQVPPTANQWRAAEPIVDAFLAGLGAMVEHLGAWLDQAAGGLVALVTRVMRNAAGTPQMSETVTTQPFAAVRTGRARTSADLRGEFAPRVGYVGFTKSLYAEDWFDSRPERDLANIVDDADDVLFWLRLQRGDLTILWRGQDSWYNPDFLIREADGGSWIVEVKSDRDMVSADVQAKKEAAERWARRVNASGVAGKWRYLLVSESQLKAATGDWRRLKAQYTGE